MSAPKRSVKTQSSTVISELQGFGHALSSRIVRGVGAGLFGQALTVGQRLFLIPLFLAHWGIGRYGDWLLLSSFAAYFAVLDLGAGIYLVNRLTQAFAVNDMATFRAYLHTGMICMLLAPAIALAIIAASTTMFTISGIVHLAALGRAQATAVLLLSVFLASTSLPMGLLFGIYRAIGLLPRSIMLSNIITLLQLGATAMGLAGGCGLIAIALIQIGPVLLVAGFASVELQRTYPQFGLFSAKDAEVAILHKIARPSLEFFTIQISQVLSVQGTLLIVGTLFGSVEIVIFSTLRTLANLIRQSLGSLINSSWPEFTRFDARAEHQQLAILFGVVMRVTMAAATAVALMLHWAGALLYQTWLHKTVPFSKPLLDLFLIYVGQQTFWTICGSLLMAVNRHRFLSGIYLCSACLSVGVCVAAGKIWGLTGVVAGLSVADFALPTWLVPLLLYRYNRKFSLGFYLCNVGPCLAAAALGILVPPLTPIVGVALAVWCMRGLPVASWMRQRLHGSKA